MQLDEALALCARQSKENVGKRNSFFGFVSADDSRSSFHRHICVSGLGGFASRFSKTEPYYFFMGYNKSGVQNDGTPEPVEFNSPEQKAMYQNEFSRRWVDFLVGPLSPWRCILDRLVSTPEYCDASGFLFRDAQDIPYRLIYTFCQATRFAWEHPKKFRRWLDCCSEGIDPRMAVLLAAGYRDGRLIYTHHFTLDTDIRAFAYRWLNSDPLIDTDNPMKVGDRRNGFNVVFRTDNPEDSYGVKAHFRRKERHHRIPKP